MLLNFITVAMATVIKFNNIITFFYKNEFL